MDINGSRHWGLHDAVHWPLDPAAHDSAAVVWQRCALGTSPHGALRLRSGLPAGVLVPLARPASPVRAALDAQGALLWWDGSVLVSVGAARRDASGVLHTPDPLRVELPAEISAIAALALGDDGVLYLACGEALWLIDRRGRALPQQLATPGFAATALAARPGGGVWAFDGARGVLARTQGTPLPRQGVAVEPDEGAHFHPLNEHPDPTRLIVLRASLRADDSGMALAVRPDGLLALLVQRSVAAIGRREAPAAVHLLDGDEQWTPAFEVGDAGDGSSGWTPHELAWRDDTTLALLGHAALRDTQGVEQHNASDCVALLYSLDAQTLADVLAGVDRQPPRIEPAGDYLPLIGHDGGPLLVPPPAARLAWRAMVNGTSSDAAQVAAAAGTTAAASPTPPALSHAGLGYVCNDGVFSVIPRPGGQLPLKVPRLRLRSVIAVPQPHRVVSGWRANALPAWAAPDSDPVLAPSVIDSHDPQTTWGRLWIEADVPRGCAVVVWLAASDVAPPALPAVDGSFFGSAAVGSAPGATTAWWPHLVGDAAALPAALAAWPDLPRAAWHARATEVLGGQSRLGLVDDPPRPGERGLFEALVQRAGVAVRNLQGRRLWVAVELFGNGRDTPVLAALRATGARFSYRDQYLPALYGESLDGALANAPARATGADFLERLLASFESEFTRIEGAIASAHTYTLPGSCPADYLDWLGQWVGLAFEPGLPEARRRSMLRALPALWRLHGTVRGLELALELVTGGLISDEAGDGSGDVRISGGAVSGGAAIVVENWRLRRTFATILGAELFDRDDPLIAGLVRSGNSLVGDSLVLGDPLNPDFMALYRTLTDAPSSGAHDPRTLSVAAGRAQARQTLYDELAHRATVLVHNELGGQDLGLMRRVCEWAAPAHVRVSVIPARWPFICAVASLVGVDTYLLAGPPQRGFTVGGAGPAGAPTRGIEPGSQLGGIDRLGEGATLDASLDDYDFSGAAKPLADLVAPALQPLDQPLLLDARGSRAAPGHSLVAYRWRLNERP